MAVKIGSNIPSLLAQRRLGDATTTLSKTYERLSSGQRINHASDDAAGLAISKTLEAKSKIFSQAIRNVNDGISFSAIAEGALRELKNIVSRQRELATQSASGTFSDAQRGALDNEFQQLSSEWNRMLDSTTFNGRQIFSQTEGRLSIQAGIGSDGVLFLAFDSAAAAAQDDTTLVNVTRNGIQGSDDFHEEGRVQYLSGDGRYVVFVSSDSNLVNGDTNGEDDILLKDLVTGELNRISTDSSGTQGNGYCDNPMISADGRYVAFQSSSTNLVEGNTSGLQVFVKNLVTGEIKLASSDSSWGELSSSSQGYVSISRDGRYVAFGTSAGDIFRKDMITGSISLASTNSSGVQGDDTSSNPVVTGDGRYVVFDSWASNLVTGDSNGTVDIFVKDLVTGETRRVSTDSSEGEADRHSQDAAISADGRYVTFTSYASNLVAGDANGDYDVFRKDLITGETRLVSSNAAGVQANSASWKSAISADGRYVTFYTGASNLISGDTRSGEIVIKDMLTGEVKRVSTDSSGMQAAFGEEPVISADGRYVGFLSQASNLVPGDTNEMGDIFTIGNPFVAWSQVSRARWLTVSTAADALIAQDKLDVCLSELNEVEGKLGAAVSRLATAANTLRAMGDNFRSAESRITDADMGQEAATLTRTQIVQQAASAVLAQANQQPEIALQLLSS